MATLNEKPVRLFDMAASMGLVPGQSFTRDQAIQWFAKEYPNVKQGTVAAHLIRLSTNVPTRLQYSPRPDGSDDRFYKIDSTRFRLYEPGRDPTPISELTPSLEYGAKPRRVPRPGRTSLPTSTTLATTSRATSHHRAGAEAVPRRRHYGSNSR